MHLHNCRCFQEHPRMLLQSLRALCLAPVGSGSVWKYLEALLRSPGVSGRIAWGFRTEFHFADAIVYPVPLRRNSNQTHMNLNCQPEIKILSSDWLPGTPPLLLWPKKRLLGIGIGVGYKLSHNGVNKKEIEDLNWSNGIQLGEWDEQMVPCFVRRDNWL